MRDGGEALRIRGLRGRDPNEDDENAWFELELILWAKSLENIAAGPELSVLGVDSEAQTVFLKASDQMEQVLPRGSEGTVYRDGMFVGKIRISLSGRSADVGRDSVGGAKGLRCRFVSETLRGTSEWRNFLMGEVS